MADDRCIPGLTANLVDAGASSRARVGDVDAPRACGRTRQDDLRKFSFQIPSKHSDFAFYTIDVSCEGRATRAEDLTCACSCPFEGRGAARGWCKHVVACLRLLVDANAVDGEPSRTPDRGDPSHTPDRGEPSRAQNQGEPAAAASPPQRPPNGAEPAASPSRAKRRRIVLRCARCLDEYDAAAPGGCRMPHPAASVDAGRCARCGGPADGLCFDGPHEPSLAVVDAEGWPSDDE